MRRFVPLVVLALSLLPAFAHAQAPPPPSGQPAQTPPAKSDDEFKDSYIAPWFGQISLSAKGEVEGPKKKMLGVSAAFWQRGILGAEIDLGIANKFFEDGPGAARLLTITANANIGPWIKFTSQQGLRPYLVVGGGLARTTFKDFLDFDNTSSNRGVITIGGGAHFYLAKAFGVRVDYRILKDFGSKDDTEDSGDFGLTGRNFKRFTVGAMFCF